MDILLFVLSYLIQLLANGILLYRVWSVRSVHGLSADTQVCLLLSALSRCVWTLKTRIIETHFLLTMIAGIELLFSTLSAALIVYLFRKFRHTSTLSTPSTLSAPLLIVLALVCAYLINPGTWFSFSAQILVAFTMYIEGVALVPQLWVIRKIGDVEALTSHYIGLLVVARIVRMLFWIVMFFDGQKFLCLFVADLLHTLLSIDYLYLWVKKLRHGGRLVYSI